MADLLYGGQALLYLYRVDKTGGAYVIHEADGTTVATDTTGAVLAVADYIEQTQLVPASDGTMKVTVDNYDVSEEVVDFLNSFGKASTTSAGTAPPPFKNEAGIEKGSSGGSSDKYILWVSYGPLNSAGTKMLMHWGLATLDMSSGQIVFKDGQWIKPVLILNSISAEYDLTVPVALFDGTKIKITGTGAITTTDTEVSQYNHYMRKYLAKAA